MPRFVTKKWVEFHDPSGDANNSYKLSKLIRSKTSMLRSDLCNFSDVYIFVKGTITVTNPDNDVYDKKQQDVFGITTEMNQISAGGGADNNITKQVLLENWKVKHRKKKAEIVLSLKHLSIFWRTLNMPLINCEINLILTWFENCALTSKAIRNAAPARGGNPAVVAIDNPINATSKITDTKLQKSFQLLLCQLKMTKHF